MADKKASEFTSQASVADSDEVVGLKAGAPDATKDSRWLMSVLRTYFQNGLATVTALTSGLASKLDTSTYDAHVAAADPHTGYQKESEKGAANGYAPLGADSLVPSGNLPAITDVTSLSALGSIDSATRFLAWNGSTVGYTTGAAIQAAYGGSGDSIAPEISDPIPTSAITSSGFTFTPTTNEGNGEFFYVVDTAALIDTGTIEGADVVLGKLADGTTNAAVASSFSVSASGAQTPVAITGRTGNTSYKVAGAHRDAALNLATNAVKSATVLTKPGQVAAPTLSSPSAGTLRGNFSAPTGGAASYTIYYGTASDLTGASSTSGTPGNNDISVAAGDYYMRVDSVNASGTTTGAIAGPQTVAGAGGLMLDSVSDVVAAYSTRQLRTAYAGAAIRVQRSSDSTQQDIGFAAGVLDTAALASFVGADTGTLVKWYDQSGNGNDLTATPTGPTVRASSANIVINSTRPAMRITGNLPTGAYSVNPTNTRRVFAVAKKDSLSGGGALLGASATGGFLFRVEATTGNLQLLKQAALNLATSTSGITAATASVMEASYNPSSGAYTFYLDGTAVGSGTNAQTMTAATPVLAGTNGAGDTFSGEIGELVITDASGDIPSGTRTAIEDDMQAYWGTP